MTDLATTTDFNKTVRLGTTEVYSDRYASVYCKIKYKDCKLSISGVEGPTRNGNAIGSCGQIVMHRPKIKDFAEGWDKATVDKFYDAWDAWHLNDMQAGCQHQRAKWDTTEKITRYRWTATNESLSAKNSAEAAALNAAKAGETFTPTPEQVAALATEYEVWTETEECPAGYKKPSDRPTETKTAGWLKPSEHGKGLLTKPCEVCGYKYGTAWLREDVPADVLSFLQSLPDTDQQPAWV